MNRDDVDIILECTSGHALLYGPRGVAKTTTACEAALPELLDTEGKLLRTAQEIFQTTFTAEAGAAQYLGHYVPQGGEFVWHKGPFQRAWEEGGLLVINEVDHASEDTSNLLHAILDDGMGANLTLPTGETIQPAAGFRCIATMNGLPSDLEPAVLDRFRIRIPVLQPSQSQIDSLPLDVARTCKELYSKGQAEKTTFRMLASFVKLRTELAAKYDPRRAERLAAAAIYGDDNEGQALLKAIKLNETPPPTRAST